MGWILPSRATAAVVVAAAILLLCVPAPATSLALDDTEAAIRVPGHTAIPEDDANVAHAMAAVPGDGIWGSQSEEGNGTNESDLPEIPPMEWPAYYTLGVCILLVLALSLDLLPIAAAMFLATLSLQLPGIISISEALTGLSSDSVVAVQLLLLAVNPIAELPWVRSATRVLLGACVDKGGKSFFVPRLKVVLVTYAVSWFFGNVTTTLMLTTMIHQLCIENGLPASQLLMSVNSASLIGGCFSVIGVSSTLIIQGMVVLTHMKPIPFFEMFKVSGITAIIALVYLVFVPHWLLSSKKPALTTLVQDKGESFIAQFIVLGTSPLIGKPLMKVAKYLPPRVQEHTQVIAVERKDGELMVPLEQHMTVAEGDVIEFAGRVDMLSDSAKWLHLEWVPLIPAEDHGEGRDAAVGGGGAAGGGVRATLGSSRTDEPTLPLRSSSMHLSFDIRGTRASLYPSHRSRHLARSASQQPSPSFGSSGSTEDICEIGGEDHSNRMSFAKVGSETPCFSEVVLSERSPLVRSSLGASQYTRDVYRAVVVAIRQSWRGKDVTDLRGVMMAKLRPGDTLLVVAKPSNLYRFSSHFLSITVVGGAQDDGFAQQNSHYTEYIEVPLWFPFGQTLSRGTALHEVDDADTAGIALGRAPTYGTTTFPARNVNAESMRDASDSMNERCPLTAATSSHGPLQLTSTGGEGISGCSPGATGPTMIVSRKRVIRFPPWYPYLAVFLFFGAVAASISGISLALALEVVVVLLVVLRLMPVENAMRRLNVDVFIIMAFSFGIGSAMRKSNLSLIAGMHIAQSGLGGWPLLFLISLLSSMLANAISSKASVQVLFPIFYDVYVAKGQDPLPATVLLATSTAISFITPYAHASNLIVMGPGGYTSKDYIVSGIPLNLITCLCLTTTTSLMYNMW